jgi:hypothetical protein
VPTASKSLELGPIVLVRPGPQWAVKTRENKMGAMPICHATGQWRTGGHSQRRVDSSHAVARSRTNASHVTALPRRHGRRISTFQNIESKSGGKIQYLSSTSPLENLVGRPTNQRVLCVSCRFLLSSLDFRHRGHDELHALLRITIE